MRKNLILISFCIFSLSFASATKYDDYDDYGQDEDSKENNLNKYSKSFLLDPLKTHLDSKLINLGPSHDYSVSNSSLEYEKKMKDVSEMFDKVAPKDYLKLYKKLLGVYKSINKNPEVNNLVKKELSSGEEDGEFLNKEKGDIKKDFLLNLEKLEKNIIKQKEKDKKSLNNDKESDSNEEKDKKGMK